jgi:hypothetical protein
VKILKSDLLDTSTTFELQDVGFIS